MRHTIDVMHLEKNVSTLILGFILAEKDAMGACTNMQIAGSTHHCT